MAAVAGLFRAWDWLCLFRVRKRSRGTARRRQFTRYIVVLLVVVFLTFGSIEMSNYILYTQGNVAFERTSCTVTGHVVDNKTLRNIAMFDAMAVVESERPSLSDLRIFCLRASNEAAAWTSLRTDYAINTTHTCFVRITPPFRHVGTWQLTDTAPFLLMACISFGIVAFVLAVGLCIEIVRHCKRNSNAQMVATDAHFALTRAAEIPPLVSATLPRSAAEVPPVRAGSAPDLN